MSHYGSETALELFAKAELMQADLKMEGLPYLETHLDVESTEDVGGQETVVRHLSNSCTEKIRFSKKNRRTSSDNVSTPASNRSRSPSIMSTEEEEDDEEINEERARVEADIDKVVQLVHKLKAADIEEYRKKIV